MSFWDKVSKDVSKGVSDGLEVLRLKAVELTGEGKRRYNIFDLKSRAQKEMTVLGGTVYDLSKTRGNPMDDPAVKGVLGRINKLEKEISKLESKSGAKKARKKVAGKKKSAAKKAAPGKSAAKKKAKGK